MAGKNGWSALQAKLAAGAVLRHATGFTLPVAVGRNCGFHAHAEIELVFHPSGRGVTTLENGGAAPFAEGDVVIYAPGVRHDQLTDVAGVDCCVQIVPPAGVKLRGHLHVGRLDDLVLRAELEHLSARAPGGSAAANALLNLRTTAVLLQLLELALARTTPADDRTERQVRAAERYIQDNYARIESVDEIAAAAGIGVDHLRHVFQKKRGRSPVRQLGDVRLERARTLLAHADLPIKEIAGLCGYRDEYYFSALFKKRMGMAPGRYRERASAGRQGKTAN